MLHFPNMMDWCAGFLLVLLGGVVVGQNIEQPFVAVWNSPTQRCEKRHEIKIPLTEYGIIENTGGVWKGDKMVIFYERELGLYPYLTPEEVPINGGIPQSADLDGHFTKVEKDISQTIPDKDFSGYAVIDWENWRPMFDRNWSAMRRYQRWSRDLVRQEHPTWSDEEINIQAKKDFEKAARFLMEETLKLARKLRPKGKWGFYGFPDCYQNGEIANCSESTMLLNDQLGWMFEASNAIYPSVYLSASTDARNHIYGFNNEAFRMRSKFCSTATPVLPYTAYIIQDQVYYTKKQLEDVIQLSSDMGVNGIIIWGSSASSENKVKCQGLQDYMNDIYGPFVENVLKKSKSCSLQHCKGNGRCVKKDPLHHHYSKQNGLSPFLRKVMEIIFRADGNSCICFPGWTGKDCSEITPPLHEAF